MNSLTVKFAMAIAITTSVLALGVVLWTYQAHQDNYRQGKTDHARQLLDAGLAAQKAMQRKQQGRFEDHGIDDGVGWFLGAKTMHEVFDLTNHRNPEARLHVLVPHSSLGDDDVTPTEEALLAYFREHPNETHWHGQIDHEQGSFQVAANIQRYDASCFACHSDDGLGKQYGVIRAKPGDVAALASVSIPASSAATGRVLILEILAILALMTLMTFLAALLFRQLVGHRLAKIASLIEHAAQAPSAEKIQPLPVEGDDEIAVVARNFNVLRDRLADHQQHMDLMVEQRTAELADANLRQSEINEKLEEEIAERQAVQEEIERQSEFMHTLIQTIPSPVFYKDLQGRFIGFNRAFEKFLGKSRQELLGKTVFDLAPEDLAERYHQADAELLASPGTQSYQAQVSSASQGMRRVVFHKATFTDTQEHVIGLVGVILDVTEVEQAQQQLRRQRDFADHVLDATDAIVLVLDAQGRVVRVNEAFERTTGHRSGDATGKRIWQDLLSGDHRQRMLGQFAKVLKQRKRHRFEGEIQTRAGQRRQISWTIQPQIDPTGPVEFVIFTGIDLTDQKAAELQLQRTQFVVDHASEQVFWLNETGQCLYVNQAACESLGYDPSELVGMPVTGYDKTSAACDFSRIWHQLQANTKLDLETFHTCKDGSSHPVAVHATLVEFEGQNLVCCWVRDLTEQRRQEHELRLIRQAVDSASDAIGVATFDGEVAFVNQAFVKMFGYDAQALSEAGGPPVLYEDKDLIGRILQSAHEGQTWRGVVAMQDRDGRNMSIDLSANPVRDARGNLIGSMGIHCDLTAQRLAEQKLRDSEQRYRLLAENATDLIWQLNSKGLCHYASPASQRLLGISADQLVGQSILELTHAQERGEIEQAITQVWLNPKQRATLEHRLCREDGSDLWCETVLHAVPRADVPGAMEIHAATRDITDRVKARAAIESSQKRLSEALEGARDAVWDFNLITGQIHVTERWYAMLGEPASTESVRLDLWADRVHHDDIAQRNARLQQHLSGQTDHYEAEYRVQCHDGHWKWLGSRGRVVERDDQGKPIRMAGTIHDITRQKHDEQKLREIHEQLQAILDGIADPTLVIDVNRHVLHTNEALRQSVDMHESMRNLLCHEIMPDCPGPEAATSQCPLKQVIETKEPTRFLRRGHDEQGRETVVEIVTSPIFDAHGNVIMMVESCRDMTDHFATQRQLRTSQERYALAAAGVNDGLWEYNPATGQTYYSDRWKRMLGYAEGQIGDQLDDWLDRVHPNDVAQLRTDLLLHERNDQETLRNEHRIRNAQGQYRWVLCRAASVRDDKGVSVRIAGSLTDIHDTKLMEQRLHHDAHHDALTGLPNRKLFMRHLSRSLDRARSSEARFAMLFLDFDRFKVINDSLGHHVGDMFLKEIARRLRHELGVERTDWFGQFNTVVARLGGDEFSLLIETPSNEKRACELAEKLQHTLAAPYNLDGYEVVTTASIGIALIDEHAASPEQVLRDADTAMYRAKSNGKARHVVFDQAMHQQVRLGLELEHDLRRALERQQLRILYQPILHLETGRLASFEALLRWEHHEHGIVGPNQFIPIAEETGLIVPIGKWVMEQAAHQLKAWQDQYPAAMPLGVSVNVSKRQLQQDHLHQDVRELLAQLQMPADSLKLEVTESTIMNDFDQIVDSLEELRKLDVELMMDDFGTGHSSLGRLHQFPIDVVKIDRSFLSSATTNRNFAAIIQSIITLAHNLGLRVVCEGIETPEQLAQLQALESDMGQGYFFAKPMPAEDAEQMIRQSAASSNGQGEPDDQSQAA